MKTILVPTDFSSCAQSAANFAVEIAKRNDATIILANAYRILSTDAQFMINVDDLVERESKENLEIEKARLSKVFDIDVQTEYRYGLVDRVVLALSKEFSVDLIVMGTQGENGAVDRWLGSSTYDVVRASNIPVIAVPEEHAFENAQHFVLAWDQHVVPQEVKDQIRLVKESLGLKFRMIYVADHLENGDNVAMEKFLGSMNEYPDYDMVRSDNVAKTLETFGGENTILGVVAHRHGLWGRLSGKSTTKTLLNNARQPLFVIRA